MHKLSIFTSGYMLKNFTQSQFLIGFLLMFQCGCLVMLIIGNYEEFNIDSRANLKKIILLMIINLGVSVLTIINRII